MAKKAIYWFRNDLRLCDNWAIYKAQEQADSLAFIYLIPADIKHNYSFFKWKFLTESLVDLSNQLTAIGAKLHVLDGAAHELIPCLCKTYQIDALYSNALPATYEQQEEHKIKGLLRDMDVACHFTYQQSLIFPEDLPFPIQQLPDFFTPFRKKVEKALVIRPLCSSIEQADFFELKEESSFSQLEAKEFENSILDSRTSVPFEGGTSSGLARLEEYFWKTDLVAEYKITRNGMIGSNYSSKLSLWLAWGCLSPRMIYHELKKYEKERVSNESTYWLFFELLWRDYFQLVMLKYGAQLFQLNGLELRPSKKWSSNKSLFESWKEGQTDEALINANMIELAKTGFMSNRGRQLVASYLVNELGIDWRMGAAYFEKMLIDYDAASNWGNWAYIAGVGNDPRPNRYFNIAKQAEIYDPEREYQQLWNDDSN